MAGSMSDELSNSLTGERIKFVKSADQTDGKLLKMHITVPPTGMGPPGHRHRSVTEFYTVLSGELTVMCGGRSNTKVYRPGESISIPPLVPHRFSNHGDEVAEVDLEVVPAARFEDQLRVAFGLAHDGKTTRDGIPKNPFELALLFELADTYLTGMPMWFQSAVFGPLAALGRRLGYDPDFPQYTRPTGNV